MVIFSLSYFLYFRIFTKLCSNTLASPAVFLFFFSYWNYFNYAISTFFQELTDLELLFLLPSPNTDHSVSEFILFTFFKLQYRCTMTGCCCFFKVKISPVQLYLILGSSSHLYFLVEGASTV